MTTTATQPVPGGDLVSARRRRAGRWTFDKASFMAVFLGLPLVIYLVFVVSPFAQAVYYSLTDWSGFSPTQNFIGLRNFERVFTDDIFLKSLRNNIVLAIVLPVVTLTLSFALASLITVGGSMRGQTRGLKASGFYRTVSFFPYVIPAIVIGIMWSQIYDPSNGLLNGILTALGFEMFESFPWLGDERTAMAATIFVIVWSMVGFYMVLFVAAIKDVPAETFEAARIDGAGRFRIAISITLPLIRDNVQTAWIYLGILALDAFVYMAALNPGGGPNNSTLVMAQQLFTTAFTKGQFGLACAMGVVLAGVTLLFAALVFAVSRLLGGKDDGRR
ncbi:sugar ABC transporter permease protein [Microlunatus phosphovorus NM-1]|uniref:Sugar ABC transporter permease protein n=1 Tax=Microlunatus phosphovorus (strain ATCC 700054 / DSM 10555 / JCM 9379 / NBRC 101784 / NCIMB 13414 / VKM Ac-1990 / NM-1) TaxID=1032480 RepID=F5XKK2_MICPN|nr:sugar ABC transporter permease [Microlunatus phosphovorus]BAK36074.1 sugar ABC transporter permease protein [Microlunatus phosphovorus NM-1]